MKINLVDDIQPDLILANKEENAREQVEFLLETNILSGQVILP